jgi:CheY-like chemotaxis protein
MKLMTATATPTLSVLLVEDEVMIRMMIAEMLEELGHRVAAETGEIDQAIRLAQNTEFDLAVLDVNVQGKLITPVAELITALNRPTAGEEGCIKRSPSVAKVLDARALQGSLPAGISREVARHSAL